MAATEEGEEEEEDCCSPVIAARRRLKALFMRGVRVGRVLLRGVLLLLLLLLLPLDLSPGAPLGVVLGGDFAGSLEALTRGFSAKPPIVAASLGNPLTRASSRGVLPAGSFV